MGSARASGTISTEVRRPSSQASRRSPERRPSHLPRCCSTAGMKRELSPKARAGRGQTAEATAPHSPASAARREGIQGAIRDRIYRRRVIAFLGYRAAMAKGRKEKGQKGEKSEKAGG